jgi:ribosomal protein S21
MRKRRNFRKKPKDTAQGLSVTVYNNNVDMALKKLKRKVKNDGLLLQLKERQYYRKPSEIKREKMNKIKSRIKYQTLKEKNSF